MTGSYIDPETTVLTKVRQADGKVLALVMSDEFRESNRGFGPGEDIIFEALEKPDDTNESIVFCKLCRDCAEVHISLVLSLLVFVPFEIVRIDSIASMLSLVSSSI